MLDALLSLGEEQFVSLTTFRRSGTGVATPVWVAPAADSSGGAGSADAALVVTTISTTGKAKRIRHDRRVQLVGCTRSGQVAPDAVPVDAQATLVTDPAQVSQLSGALRRKYGPLFALFLLAARLPRKNKGERVMIVIRPASNR
ncbi:MAG: PPOX class F420-dependent oxidoreductase [Propionibacteriaceae bacterium]